MTTITIPDLSRVKSLNATAVKVRSEQVALLREICEMGSESP